jgi:nucleoside-diphosphate-sugar epimerase
MRVAITGATGFIGNAMVREARARGHDVIALYRGALPRGAEPATWKHFDSWLSASDAVDVVIHAAALRHRHGIRAEDYAAVNIGLTQRVLDRAIRGGAERFVHVSSISVYGWPPRDRLPIDESFPFDPTGPYGDSKVRTERLVMDAQVPWTIVQPSITYGPGDTNGMVDKMMRMIARHLFVLPGLGRTRVQLVYIDDLARITLLAAEARSAVGARFICTYADPIRVRDLVRCIARSVHGNVLPFGLPTSLMHLVATGFEGMDRMGVFAGREPPLTRDKLATISVDRAYKIATMRHLLGTEPHVGYVEGLARTARAMNLA